MAETRPLIAGSVATALSERRCRGRECAVVDFDPEGDPENPIEWPKTYKWLIVSSIALLSFTVSFTCVSVAPITNRIAQDLDQSDHPSQSARVILVSIWELGEAVGPILLAPLSEMFGRAAVLNSANLLFVTATILAALAPSTSIFIVVRAMTGLAVSSNVLGPAIVGDMFEPEERGSAMSLLMVASFIGGASGPVVSGAIAEAQGWRSVMWLSVAMSSACATLLLILFRETYSVHILQRRIVRQRLKSGDVSDQTACECKGESQSTLKEAILRPFHVFSGSGVLQILSIFGSMAFSFMYIKLTTLPDILQGKYHLSESETGLAFLCFNFGSCIGVAICNTALDKIYVHLRRTHGNGTGHPEYRLPLLIVCGVMFPLVILFYGWTAQVVLPLPLMLLSVTLMGMAVLFGILPLMSYVVDAFPVYSASAVTAVLVTRCLTVTWLPLVAGELVQKMDWGPGFTVLALACLMLAPIPVVIWKYGAEWRQRSEYTRTSPDHFGFGVFGG